jgi:hypothetical protein
MATRKTKAAPKADKPAESEGAPESTAKAAPQPELGDLVEVHENQLNVHGFFRVDELGEEGIVIAPLDGHHNRMRVSAESITAIHRSL